MPHIHTNPGQHDFTASAFIVRLDTPKPSLMLHMHKILKVYLQFGGHVELHENPWQAVMHELSEESGYAIEQLKLLQPSSRIMHASDAILHPYPLFIQTIKFGDLDHYHNDIAYAFVTSEPPKNQPADGESSQIETFTAIELRALPKGAIPENVRETGLFALEECLKNWEQVKI